MYKKIEKRYKEIAKTLVHYSTKVKPGDVVIVESFDVPISMITAIIDLIQKAGAHPVSWLKSWAVLQALLKNASIEEIDIMAHAELIQMKKADVYIGLRASVGNNEFTGVSSDKQSLFKKHWLGKVHYQERVQNTRWCSVKWPTVQAAAISGMTYEEFEKYYLKVCFDVNYEKMYFAMNNLVRLLDKTDHIRIIGLNTDISFSKKGIPSVGCAGSINIPDGEIYTAPIRESVNGKILYNIASTENGEYFDGVAFVFRDGKIIDATCRVGNVKLLRSILSVDEGASYIGEFAFGINPLIIKPINDRMFDEKMTGSIHLTPGNSYSNAFNGNKSSLHWDLILNQTDAYGGGEIYFDGVLVRKNGIFILSELENLNPKALLKDI